MKRSTRPIKLFGHTNSISFCLERSPMSSIRSLPYVITLPAIAHFRSGRALRPSQTRTMDSVRLLRRAVSKYVSRRSQDLNLEPHDRNSVAGFGADPFRARNGFLVGRVVFTRHIGIFKILPVIHERADLHAACELRHAADMITVKVGNQHVVELRHTSRFAAAPMRAASRPSKPGQPVSISMDSPDGLTIRVDCPPSTSIA